MAYRRTSYARRAARTYTRGRAMRRSRRALLRPRRTYVRGRGSYRVTAPKSQARGRAFGRSIGESVGNLIGSRFGPGVGSAASAGLGWLGDKIGAWGGNKIGTALGWGGYHISKNTIAEGTAVPYMHKKGQVAQICHREFLGDVTAGSVANKFDVNYINLQPTNRKMAPWLSNLASQYQEYRIKGMMFHFVSTTAASLVSGSINNSNNIGTVIMATSYNAGIEDPFPNKSAMENTQYTESKRLSENMNHCIECDPRLMPQNLWYIRTGPVPAGQPVQLYDYAKFAIATISPYPDSVLGELWVSYDIELIKPILRDGVNVLSDTFQAQGPFTGATQYNMLGSAVVHQHAENSIGGAFYGLAPSATLPNGGTMYRFGPNCKNLTFLVTITGQLAQPDPDNLATVAQPFIPAIQGGHMHNNVVAVNNWYMFAPAGGALQGQCGSNNIIATFALSVDEDNAIINFTHVQGFQTNGGGQSLQLVVTQIDSDIAYSKTGPGFKPADDQSNEPGYDLFDPLLDPSNATTTTVVGA